MLKVTEVKGLCNNCLVSGHVVKQCPKASFCKIEGCQSKHSTFLHPVNKKHDSKNEPREVHEKSEGSEETTLKGRVISILRRVR